MKSISAAKKASVAAITLQILLLIWIVLGRLSPQWDMRALIWSLLFCVPLLLPLRGMIKGYRYTHAWATLCVIPYFIIGITEVIANPATRLWAGVCLALSLALFVALIAQVRLSKKSD